MLQKKNKVARRRNISARHMTSRRTATAAANAKQARAEKQEAAAVQSFRAHAVHSKLMLLQQDIMRRAAVQSKEGELERELEKRQQLLVNLTNLVGARQALAEDGLGDLLDDDGQPASEAEALEALTVELSTIDQRIEGCEMKIAAVTGTIQECSAELKVHQLNSQCPAPSVSRRTLV